MLHLFYFIGIVLPICGWLMLKRTSYSRLIYIIVLLVSMILPLLYMQEYISIIFGLVLVILIACYLFGKSSVREYFASNKRVQIDGSPAAPASDS